MATTSRSRRAWTLVLVALVVGLLAVPSAATAHEDPDWAPVSQATITPGVQTVTDGSGQCTANFIFTDAADVYIGQSAHCAGIGGATDTNGCLAGSQPLGTSVTIEGATQPGTLAYSSWLTMQAHGETDVDTCAFNDFALVRIDPADHGLVNPSVPFHGGPVGVNTDGTGPLDAVFTYGNSSLRLGIELLSPKTGRSLGTTNSGWNHPVYTITPGVPGDSGSAFMDSSGAALGTLSTLALAPLPASNGVTDINLAIQYVNGPGGMDISLAEGTEDFTATLLPPLPLPGVGL